jgi:Protein of unknown function (DUF4238)
MSVPKKQHVIPCLHLRHFTDQNGRVWTYDALGARVWAATPEETATEQHFYSGELADGSIDTSIETHLASVESKTSPMYADLLAGRIPGEAQARMDFAHFLGLMYSRTRAMRRVAAEASAKEHQITMYATAREPQAFEAVVGKYEAEIGRKLTEKEREGARQGMLDPSRFEWEVPKSITLRALGL